jgi:hypothetical protein
MPTNYGSLLAVLFFQKNNWLNLLFFTCVLRGQREENGELKKVIAEQKTFFCRT